jgi:hypothetical protein
MLKENRCRRLTKRRKEAINTRKELFTNEDDDNCFKDEDVYRRVCLHTSSTKRSVKEILLRQQTETT